ncbi:hypothetical protein [Nonomuraea dietziae]|uniref:hypothetical protein n=1 Tax=Nonomuraea dietziae TaxID=65515 RepID=UPI00344440DA
MDKRSYIPGTPEEVVANMLRVARQPGRARKLLGRRGRKLDPAKLDQVREAAEELAATGAVITHVHKQGFPASTPHAQALEDAERAAAAYGTAISAEVIETPEHQAAGEFLVKVLLIPAFKPDEPAAQTHRP